MNKFKATKNDQGRTLLKFLEKTLNNVPKSRIEKLFRNKDIKINNKRTSNKKYIILENDEITIYGIEYEEKKYNFIEYNFEIIYEDKNILIVNKPIGIEVHGSYNSLDKQVLSYLKFKKIDSFIPTHIGRIDKITSGIMVYGKNYNTVRKMKEKINSFNKYYRLISDLKKDVDLKSYIYHNELDQKEYISQKFGKTCETYFKVLTNGEIEAQIITGRKHQIRASLEYLKKPIKGDTKYGGISAKRVFLHSYKIIFNSLEGELEYLNNKEFISLPCFN